MFDIGCVTCRYRLQNKWRF